VAPTLISATDIAGRARALDAGWSADTERLTRTVEFDGFRTAISFLDQLAPIAEEMQHHPDLRISWRTVEVQLSTHSAGGVTDLDFTLAERLDRLIADLPLA
jgi:4a-hydroxytetrahydrobiopterin dehydratase